MTARVPCAVWVSGERFNVDYLFDIRQGRVLRRLVLNERGGTTGGIGRRCGGAFVAVYVKPGGDEIVFQVDERRVTLDDDTRASHERRLGGAMSLLTVTRPGEPRLSARQWNGAGALLRRVDPGYDQFDDLSDDFLADVADLVNSAQRRHWILETKDPNEGPWDA